MLLPMCRALYKFTLSDTHIHSSNQPAETWLQQYTQTEYIRIECAMRANERATLNTIMRYTKCKRFKYIREVYNKLRARFGYVRLSASSVSCGDETSAVSRHPLHSQSIDESRQVVSCVCFLASERILSVFHIFYRIVNSIRSEVEKFIYRTKKKPFCIRSDIEEAKQQQAVTLISDGQESKKNKKRKRNSREKRKKYKKNTTTTNKINTSQKKEKKREIKIFNWKIVCMTKKRTGLKLSTTIGKIYSHQIEFVITQCVFIWLLQC